MSAPSHPPSEQPEPVAPVGRARDWHGRVWGLAWPTILSNLSAPIVGIVDTAMVGHLGDPRYIGAVALGAVIFTFMQWAFSFLRMGTTGFTAQAFGARDYREVNATTVRALIVAVAGGTVLVAAQQPLAWLAFSAVDGSAGVESIAGEYFAIRIWGAPAVLVNMAVLGVLFGLQRMHAALATQLVLNVANVVLDVVFVVGMDLGVAGVAWASVIAEIAAAALGVVLVWRALGELGGPWRHLGLANRARVRGLVVANFNIFIRTLAVQVTFFYFTAAGARQGDVVLAANAVLLHLFQLMSFGLDGFAYAVEALAGNAFGARNPRALRAMMISAGMWSAVTAAAFCGLYALGGMWMIRLMTNVEPVIATAREFLPWVIAAPLFSVWCYLMDGVYFGTTHTRDARNSILLGAVVYFPLVWLTMPLLGNHGLWLAVLVFMSIRGVALVAWYPRIERAAARR